MTPPTINLNYLMEKYFANLALNDDDLYIVTSFFSEKTYPKKTCLLKAGEVWNRFYYIKNGIVRLYYTDKEGKESNKSFFWEDHCIWPIAPAIREQISLFNIETVEDCVVLECSFGPLHQWLKHRGDWEKFALPFIETVIEQKFLREHDFLQLSATERFQQLLQHNPNLVNRLSDYHLASYLGVTNVSLSRIKKSLKTIKQ